MLENEIQISMKIIQGQSPLDYALENHKECNDLIDENEDLKRILEMCF